MIKPEQFDKRGFAAIGLFNPKSSENVGAVMRAAGCFNASMVVIQGDRCGTRASTNTQKSDRHIPTIRVENLKTAIPLNSVPVAVDLIEGAIPLPNYAHPESAYYIFGPEDGTLDGEITSWCRDVIYIPTNFCLNLAMAVNVVLYDRTAKIFKKQVKELQ